MELTLIKVMKMIRLSPNIMLAGRLFITESYIKVMKSVSFYPI